MYAFKILGYLSSAGYSTGARNDINKEQGKKSERFIDGEFGRARSFVQYLSEWKF